MSSQPLVRPSLAYTPWAVLAGIVACTLWSYWTTLAEAAYHWAHDPQYSHGYLVPGFALLLLWLRRDRLLKPPSPLGGKGGRAGAGRAWGIPVLALGIGLRMFGAYYHYIWFDAISLLPCLLGLGLMLGGWTAWRWSWPAIGFLFFMIPLPFRLSVALTDPLQRLATTSSTFLLQTFGAPAIAEGKVILINEAQINIVEACSGLRMMVIFFALSTGVALLIHRPLWEKLVIVFSAVPIALIANITRITATGLVNHWFGSEAANGLFHDLAGWLMMPFGLLLLGLELKFLKHLWIEPAQTDPYAPARVVPRPTSTATSERRRRRAAARGTPIPAPGQS